MTNPIKPNLLDSNESNPKNNENIEGKITTWNAERGYGFVSCIDGRRAFCHVYELCEHLRPEKRGDSVKSGTKIIIKTLIESPKGLTAKEVMCEECAKPESWELQPIGEIATGVQGKVQELIPVSTKGSPSYLSPFPLETIKTANADFLKAKKEEKIWENHINEAFIELFGEAKSVKIIENSDPHNMTYDSTKIEMTFDHGVKTTTPYELLIGGHYSFTPMEEFSIEKSSPKSSYTSIYIHYECDKFPQIKAKNKIAYFSENGTPHLEMKVFEKLQKSLQYKIIEELKRHTKSPTESAERYFTELLSENHTSENIERIRTNLLYLKDIPGEAYIKSRSYKKMESYPESDDGYLPAGQMEVTATDFTIFLGAKKVHNAPDWSDYKYFDEQHSIKIYGISGNVSDIEGLKRKLISKTEDEYNYLMNGLSTRALSLIDFNPLLFDISEEEYNNEFSQRFNELIAEWEEKWNSEKEKIIRTYQAEAKEYQEALNKLLDAEQAKEAMYAKAKERLPNIYVFESRLNNLLKDPRTQTYSVDAETLLKAEEHIREFTKTGHELIETMLEEDRIAEEDRAARQIELELAQKRAEEYNQVPNAQYANPETPYQRPVYYEEKSEEPETVSKPFATIFELTTSNERERAPKKSKQAPESKPEISAEPELMSEELRKKLEKDLQIIRAILETISTLPAPNKKDPNAEKVLKLKAKTKELKGELNSFESDFASLTDANKARGKVSELERKSLTVSKEYAKLTNSAENWVTIFKEYLEKLSVIAEAQDLEIDASTLAKITPELIKLAQNKTEPQDIDSEIEEILIMNI